ncbi:MAG TPA: hypothetical protein VK599_14630 [Streptosporangiaceae bacterium]|nr:hypothetical protein [Streptosporangiaceae bacterium]
MNAAPAVTEWHVTNWHHDKPVAVYPTREEAVAHIEQAVKAAWEGITVRVALDCTACDNGDCPACEDSYSGGPGGPRQAFMSTYSGKQITPWQLVPVVTVAGLPSLLDDLRRAMAESSGFDPDGLEPDEYGEHAGMVGRVVARYIRADAEAQSNVAGGRYCRDYGLALADRLERAAQANAPA